MQFNRDTFERFRDDVKIALADVEAKYGVVITPKSIRYSDLSFDIKLECVRVGYDKEKDDFRRFCVSYGFVADDYKRPFKSKEGMFEFVGFSTNARKRPCIIRSLTNGQTYTTTIEYMRFALGKESNDVKR